MSYKIRYTGTREERRLAAFNDAMGWLGHDEARIAKVLGFVQDVLHDSDMTGRQKVRTMRLGLSFAGIQGAPAWAIMKTVAALERHVSA